MIKSMTGFGKSHLIKNEREYQIEIKSVNHRYLDISIKMPKQFTYLEEEIKKVIASKINRGKIEVYITFYDHIAQDEEITINKEIAQLYIKQLQDLAKENNLSQDINVIDIAKLPDVLNITSKQDDETIKEDILQVTNEALEKLIEMRTFEGNKIAEDLINRIDNIQGKVVEIS